MPVTAHIGFVHGIRAFCFIPASSKAYMFKLCVSNSSWKKHKRSVFRNFKSATFLKIKLYWNMQGVYIKSASWWMFYRVVPWYIFVLFFTFLIDLIHFLVSYKWLFCSLRYVNLFQSTSTISSSWSHSRCHFRICQCTKCCLAESVDTLR